MVLAPQTKCPDTGSSLKVDVGSLPTRARTGTPALQALDVRVQGVVQGVGFRPFVHRTAIRRGIAGWVRNEAGSVRILAEGSTEALDSFLSDLEANAPPLCRIDRLGTDPTRARGLQGFRVVASDVQAVGRLPVSPDVAVCDACAEELADPDDRRFRYPFITCTDCGPRFTVIESMPYDRERTTMRAFSQCPACAAEYADPMDRRYHSETNSCPDCGPHVWLERDGEVRSRDGSAIARAGRILREGGVVAVRGLGGFHLAVDAENDEAVLRLRSRKHRDDKPLAVMVRTLDQVRELAWGHNPSAQPQLV